VTDIVVEEGATFISPYAFYGWASLRSVSIPSTVTEIGDSAFKECPKLHSIYVADGNLNYVSVNGVLFDSPTTKIVHVPQKASGYIVIPEGVTSIPYAAFRDTLIHGVSIPSTVSYIDGYAFYRCYALSEVVLQEGIVSIGSDAFGATILHKIALPSTLNGIGSSAFSACYNLKRIENKSSLTLTFGSYDQGQVAQSADVIVEKDGTVRKKNPDVIASEEILTSDGFLFLKTGDSYRLVKYTGEEETIALPASMNGFSYSLYRFQGGKKIIIPDTISEIHDNAFQYNGSITEVVIGANVKTIGDFAFSECSSLKRVYLSDSVTQIGEEAFSYCGRLEAVEFGNGLELIKKGAYRSSGLISVELPASIKTLDPALFYLCDNLVSVVLPEGLVSIPSSLFASCPNLRNVSLPESLISISSSTIIFITSF
jgi:hypothetical protein